MAVLALFVLAFCGIAYRYFSVSLGGGIPTIAPEQRCPVCGMYPARFPKWKAQILLKDGGAIAFDSSLDMFRYLQSPSRYGKEGHKASDIKRVYVTDFHDGNWLEAHRAFFVVGSTTAGPMGEPAFLPFASQGEAQAYMTERGGRVLGFNQITPEIVADNGGSAHRAVH